MQTSSQPPPNASIKTLAGATTSAHLGEVAQPEGVRASRADAIALPSILVLFWIVYALSPVTTSTDSAWTFHVAASILQQRNINLDEYRSLINLQDDYRMRVVDGHIYSYYPVATPLLVTPAVWMINKVYPLVYRTDFYAYLQTHEPDTRTARLEKILASAIGALAAAAVYLLARRELGPGSSVMLAAIFAFATSMWSTATRALWQHGPSALFLAAALLLLFRARQRPRWFFWLGLVLALAYLIRPTNSLAVGFVGLYVLINFPKQVWLYVAGLAVVFIPYVAQNWFTYGNPFPPYSYQLFERFSTPSVFLEGLAGTLVSPARGLFIFSPVFLLSIYGMYLRLRGRLTLSNTDLYLAAILPAHWIMVALFQDWGGAWSVGPRYFVDVIPLLVYFLIPILRPEVLAVRGLRYALIATVLVSALIQFHASTSIYPWMWNGKPVALVEAPQRKWDWGDLQFLRGFCPSNPLEGRAPACWFTPHE
jgi:hypothetical protein